LIVALENIRFSERSAFILPHDLAGFYFWVGNALDRYVLKLKKVKRGCGLSCDSCAVSYY
jgi:hypothetical protein